LWQGKFCLVSTQVRKLISFVFQIEQWYEQNYPSFIQPPNTKGNPPTLDGYDARSRIAEADNKFTSELATRKRMIDIANGDRQVALERVQRFTAARGNPAKGSSGDSTMMILYIAAGIVLVVALGFGATFAVLKATGVSLSGST
jgi:hypothetical protein